MSEDCPSKNDITAVFKKLRSYPANKICFDCGAKNPTWSSVTYGVFICIDCSAVHRSLGVHLSFVRSTQLDTNWTWLQIRAMQLGGNSNATQFFSQHGCTTTDAQQKYKSRAAQLYRDKLHQLSVGAMRMHGTKLHIDATHSEPLSPKIKEEEDFFAQHTDESQIPRNASQVSMSDEAYIGARNEPVAADDGKGPAVDCLNNESTTGDHKKAPVTAISTGARRPAQKKGGGKKSAFGAQKVTTNFSDIEKQAEMLEKTRIAPMPEPQEEQTTAPTGLSTRFLAQDTAKREEQMKNLDPKKAEQVERLGMAFGAGAGRASHSVLADIKAIKQEETSKLVRGNSKGGSTKLTDSDAEDDWEMIGSKDRSLGMPRSVKSSDSGYSMDRVDRDERQRTQPKSTASDGDAMKKFGSAKAISSDQYFGNAGTDYETRTNLARFEGSNAISSADLFGSDGGARSRAGANYSNSVQLPDVTEIKDSVRQGVTKVAGKISQLSNSVSSYLSDNYGY